MTNMNIINTVDSVKKNLKDINIDVIITTGNFDHIVAPGPTPQPGELMKIIISDENDCVLRTACVDKQRNVFRRIGGWYDKEQLPHNDWMGGTLKGFEPKELIEIMRLMDAWCN